MAGRLFAIGDVHGCREEMLHLLDALPLESADTVVFLGDYVDRGPDSAGVVTALLDIEATRPGTIFLRGNHEDLLLDYLRPVPRYGDAFVVNGGRATAASYGVRGSLQATALAAALPPAHRDFFERTRPFYDGGDVVCVHAGVRPGVPLGQQARDDLLWIREEFLTAPSGLDALVVFGHTPHRDVVTRLPGKLGIDTGCVYGGLLTAVELPALIAYQVRRGQGEVRRRSLTLG